ncbi:hypothetical protein NDU88_001179 [Pleurodeles waltl]|uniref:Uncharacterized protein n=1 Tax=Pleurodeles waltl TaxID=8319 RepID=A0AAV7UUL5_PLEWA|nr:hypothetical protein NDU88_001179 [Pleurodeles waltl]
MIPRSLVVNALRGCAPSKLRNLGDILVFRTVAQGEMESSLLLRDRERSVQHEALTARTEPQPGVEPPSSYAEAKEHLRAFPLWGSGGSVSTSRKFSALASGEADEVGKAGKVAEADGEAVWWQEVGKVAHAS